MNTNKKQVDPSANGGTTSVSSDSSVGEADSFPSNNNRDANSVPYSLPNSKKIYVAGKPHPNIRVPFREISLAATKTMSGEIELNEPRSEERRVGKERRTQRTKDHEKEKKGIACAQ